MSYIEGLIGELEEGVSGKAGIYKSVQNDLTKEQILQVEDELKEMKALLKQAKEEFKLEDKKMGLSKIMAVNCSFIWATIEDLWSSKIEKSSGKIHSKEKKDKLDAILKQLYEHNTRIQKVIKK